MRLITPDVYGLRDQFQSPGMRILQFAFDGHADNPYLPHNYAPNTVVYTGTHDNNTTRGWFEALPEDQKRNVWNYLKRPAGNSVEVAWELIHPLIIALASTGATIHKGFLRIVGLASLSSRPFSP